MGVLLHPENAFFKIRDVDGERLKRLDLAPAGPLQIGFEPARPFRKETPQRFTPTPGQRARHSVSRGSRRNASVLGRE